MKKVLFTATVDSHILQFHLPYLKWFKEQKYEVHVATNGDEQIPYCDVKYTIPFERSPFKINNLKAIKQLKKIIDKEQFEIIHCHTPMGSVVTRIAARKARKNGTRVIYTAHGFHFYKGAPILNWCLFYPIEKWLSKYTDTLITINKEDYDLAKRKFKKCRDIEYVPGVGIDEEKFKFEMTQDEKKKLRQSLGLKESDYILIYPAELSKRKRQIWLINSIQQLLEKYKNIHLLLPGRDNLKGKCQKIVKEKNLEKQIHFLGFRDDIPKLLKISNIAVSSAKQEGLPVNIIEAMYIGIPIVASSCRGNRDLLINNKNGYLINVKNSRKFSKSIENLYKNNSNNMKSCEENINNYLLSNIMNIMIKIYTKKKKICYLLASNKFSGAENVVCTIINNLKNDYEMIYCSPSGSIQDSLKERNIEYYPLKKLSYNQLKKAIEKIKPDIIHANDYKSSCLAALFHKRAKIISHIHYNNPLLKKLNIKSAIYMILTKRFEKIIWVSKSALDDYYFTKKVKENSIVLYNIIDFNDVEKKSTLFEPNIKYDLVFLGRLVEPKNPIRLIEVANIIIKKNNKIRFAIIGDGEMKNKIQNMIDDYNLGDNVTMLGYQFNPYPYLKNAKILIMTSKYEGTPMCALEALSLGLIVVSTPVDGLKDIIIDKKNGFLLNSNEEIANKVLEILNDDILMEEMSKNSKKIFNQTNNINKYIEIMRKVYN